VRSGQYSPLRYPGGKGKLSALIKAIISQNELLDGTYVEPFAGGAGVACELLSENYVREIHINDVSPAIYSFWKAALWHDDRFCQDIETIPLTIEEWDRQKHRFETHRRSDNPDLYELGFSTFYLNRTNRSGILNAGIIGGRSQSSEWGIDARFNRAKLVKKIRLLSSMRDRIKVTKLDALSLIQQYGTNSPYRTLMYLDPPYFVKGRQLYLDFYRPSDHGAIAEAVQEKPQPFNWIVSYDNVEPIKALYTSPYAIEYDINYSARSASTGSEVIFFDRKLILPQLENYIKVTSSVAA
jgi:DNA adenine methylase